MQVARNLGKTLRTFQPTIRELQVWIFISRPWGKMRLVLYMCQLFLIAYMSFNVGCFKRFQKYPWAWNWPRWHINAKHEQPKQNEYCSTSSSTTISSSKCRSCDCKWPQWVLLVYYAYANRIGIWLRHNQSSLTPSLDHKLRRHWLIYNKTVIVFHIHVHEWSSEAKLRWFPWNKQMMCNHQKLIQPRITSRSLKNN